MKWFRANIKHGSRLALLALAIQFVLAFGHFHAIAAAQAAPGLQSALPQAGVSSSGLVAADSAGQSTERQQSPCSDHDSGQNNDGCAICAVIAMANAALFANPPLLLLPEAVEFLYRATDAEFAHLNSVRVAFQPRVPPIA